VGSSITIVCKVQSVVPFRSQWSKGLESIGSVTTEMGIANITHSILSASTRNEGLYTCFASNVGGTGSSVTRLVVKGMKPYFYI
jgi:hypothetical protein